MITVLITENEQQIMTLLSRVLREGGFSVSNVSPAALTVGRANIAESVPLGDKSPDLGDAIFSEKKGVLYKEIVGTIEKRLIEQVLRRTEGNQLKAAKILGINRNTIRSKIKKLEIDAKRWKEQ